MTLLGAFCGQMELWVQAVARSCQDPGKGPGPEQSQHLQAVLGKVPTGSRAVPAGGGSEGGYREALPSLTVLWRRSFGDLGPRSKPRAPM